MTFTNLQRVRILYKTILRLHRGLPSELCDLGSKYVRDEFKRHKKCDVEEAEIFVNEWTSYAITLAEQLGLKGPHTGKTLGASLSACDLDKFKDDQVYQLYELMEAARASKRVDEYGS